MPASMVSSMNKQASVVHQHSHPVSVKAGMLQKQEYDENGAKWTLVQIVFAQEAILKSIWIRLSD
jgi:hypothetical protein